eukprot:gene3127-3963_t
MTVSWSFRSTIDDHMKLGGSMPNSSSSEDFALVCAFWDVVVEEYSSLGCVNLPNPAPPNATFYWQEDAWAAFVQHEGDDVSVTEAQSTWGMDHAWLLRECSTNNGNSSLETSSDTESNAGKYTGELCEVLDPDNRAGCFWDDMVGRFRGTSCVWSEQLQCRCTHLTDFVADLEKFAVDTDNVTTLPLPPYSPSTPPPPPPMLAPPFPPPNSSPTTEPTVSPSPFDHPPPSSSLNGTNSSAVESNTSGVGQPIPPPPPSEVIEAEEETNAATQEWIILPIGISLAALILVSGCTYVFYRQRAPSNDGNTSLPSKTATDALTFTQNPVRADGGLYNMGSPTSPKLLLKLEDMPPESSTYFQQEGVISDRPDEGLKEVNGQESRREPRVEERHANLDRNAAYPSPRSPTMADDAQELAKSQQQHHHPQKQQQSQQHNASSERLGKSDIIKRGNDDAALAEKCTIRLPREMTSAQLLQGQAGGDVAKTAEDHVFRHALIEVAHTSTVTTDAKEKLYIKPDIGSPHEIDKVAARSEADCSEDLLVHLPDTSVMQQALKRCTLSRSEEQSVPVLRSPVASITADVIAVGESCQAVADEHSPRVDSSDGIRIDGSDAVEDLSRIAMYIDEGAISPRSQLTTAFDEQFNAAADETTVGHMSMFRVPQISRGSPTSGASGKPVI